MLEVHLELHKDVEKLKWDTCSKMFHLKWRLLKHQEMHKFSNTKICQYFNNAKMCPYQEVGFCMRLLKNVILETNVKIECVHINIQVWRRIYKSV